MPSFASDPPPKVSSCSAAAPAPAVSDPCLVSHRNRSGMLLGQGTSRGLSCPRLAEGLQRFLLLVYAGLTGSVTMISCTVLALTRLFFEFKGELRGWGPHRRMRQHPLAKVGAGGGWLWLSPAVVADHLELSVVEQLLQNVCLLLASRTRDVVKAALGFLKVTLLLVDTKLLAKHVQTMVRSCTGCPEEDGRAELGLPWAAGGVSSCTLLLPESQEHNLDLGG